MKRPSKNSKEQRGVAVIMALLLTTLAITIVASLFWQQQVQVRLIENQRLQLQKQWILRGALDWASLILREDARFSSVDTLDEPWAAPLAETRLDRYVENGKAEGDIADTTLAGHIEDAQARFNLNDLAMNGAIDPASMAIFTRLLTALELPTALASDTATQVALVTLPAATVASTTRTPQSDTISRPIAWQQIEELLSVAGWSPALLAKVKPYLVCLPQRTPININTASAVTLAALLDIPLQEAQKLVISRKSASFRDLADLTNRLPAYKSLSTAYASTTTNYFLVSGKVHMNRAQLDMLALIERNGATTRTNWILER